MDAIDAALVDINNNQLSVIHYHQFPISRDIQQRIRSVNADTRLADISELDAILGDLFAEAVLSLLEQSGLPASAITAIGSHGQTVLHLPEANHARTVQIGDPSRIAVRTGITTVADFRRNDIAAGGQGAPLACGFHAWRFRHPQQNRIILNLGGIANITRLPADPSHAVTGFDTGPANVLMDSWTRLQLQQEYDQDGLWAASGHCNELLLARLLDEPYFNLAPPKSTGKDLFNLHWLNQKISSSGLQIAAADIQACLLELSARSISAAITRYASDTNEVLICGGGAHNRLLVQRLIDLLPGMKIDKTDAYGIKADAVEAVTFAWLAKCRLDNITANIPAVTGARRSVLLGAVYPA